MATQPQTNQQANYVLRCLSGADLALIQPYLKPVELSFRKRLQYANCQIKTVYFPESGLGSVVAVSGRERRQAEVGVVGRDGMTGFPIVHGTDRAPCDIFMQVEGAGQCISVPDFREVLAKSVTCYLASSAPRMFLACRRVIRHWLTLTAPSKSAARAGF